MLKNKHSYWNWQGNHAQWHNYYLYIGLAIMFTSIFMMWIFRMRMQRWWANKNRWLFVIGSERRFWSLVGTTILIIEFVRFILFINYVNQWEMLLLHLCRLHIMVIAVLLTIGKIDKIKYFAIMAFVGAFFTFLFGNLSASVDLENLSSIDTTGLDHLTSEEKLLIDYGFKFYSAGPDNFIFQEFFLGHLFIGILPTFLWITRRWNMKLKELFFMGLMYSSLTLLMWTLNWISIIIPDSRWHANLWYIGTNDYNEMSNVFGWASSWPQNLFMYGGVIGWFVVVCLYLLIQFFSNIVWFENNKIIQFIPSKQWLEFKQDFSKIFLKRMQTS